MKSKKWIFRLIGLAILIYLVLTIDLHLYVSYFREIEVSGIIYASLLVLLIYFIKSFRWKILLQSQDIHYKYRDTFLSFTSSNFIAFITPGRLGEFAKVIYLRNDLGTALSRSISSVVTDRLFDVYILLFFGFFGIIKTGIGSTVVLFVFILVSLLFPFLLFNKRILDKWVAILSHLPLLRKIVSGKDESVKQFKEGFLQLLSVRLIPAAILSLISYLLLYLAAWFLTGSIHIQISLLNIILVVSVANILSFLPISISGLGTREAVFIFFLSRFGYSSEQALVFSTLFFVCFYIIGGMYGYICFMIKPVSLSFLRKQMK